MIFDLKNCTTNESSSIKDALKKMEINTYGFIFTVDDDEKVSGLATDGDVRRGLINGITLNMPILKCANPNFLSASTDTTREQLIKRLDSQIKFIPILSKEGKLDSIISKSHLPLPNQNKVYYRSRAPVRVSFGGGGSDLTHYFKDNSGAVINSTISIYSHATMKPRNDSKICIYSSDLQSSLTAKNLGDALSQKGPFGLIQSLLHIINPAHGFDLYLRSDFPLGSGLGGSATISAAVLGCFNMLRQDKWKQHELAEIAFQAERLHLGINGGWQDQYASVFGGFNFIEFNADENIVSPIRLDPDVRLELEENLILCNTGINHNSGDIHDNQEKTMSESNIKSLVEQNVKLTFQIRNHLLKGNLKEFANCLNEAWKLKKNFSPMISNNAIDKIYDGAIGHGASGGKLLGAGGGGFFIFYATPFNKDELIKFLKSQNLTIKNFQFESDGLKSWASRDQLN